MTNVNQDNVHSRLRGSDHVLGRSNELDDRVIKLVARPSIARLISDLVPVEQLRHFVGHVTHAASPAEFARSFT